MKIISSRAVSSFFLMALFALLSACGGGGSGSSTTTPVTPVPTAAAISLSSSATSVASDNSNSATITATVVNASNAAVAGVTVTFSADSGFLGASSAVSDSTGKATVTFSAGNNPTTRTATIIATASGQTSQYPIRVSGSTLTITTTASSLTVGSTTATLSVVAKNAGATALAGQTITLTQSGTGSVAFSAASGTTDSTGTFSTTVTPLSAGLVTITITGVGETRTTALTIIGTSTSAFQITSPAASSTAIAGTLNTALTFTASAPSTTTSVTFVSTLGTWNGTTSNIVTVPTVGGIASASLTATAAGVANVQVYDTARPSTPSLSDSRVASFTAPCSTAYRLTLQSTPSVVAPSSSGTANISTLLATLTDPGGNPVGNCPIAFNIINPTGGGETVAPVVVISAGAVTPTLGLGQATTTFTAGSLSSGAGGVQVRATVVGTGIKTATLPSGSDATIVIGGTAGSVTIGVSTTVGTDTSNTIYTLPMSVLVSDANGNPVTGATVSLSAWPIAFNVGGTNCTGTTYPGSAGTYYFNEDVNENLTLDPGEDGVRKNYVTGVTTTGTADGRLTPANSAAGTLPSTVTTGTNGVATFTLTYTKSSAFWIIDRIRARTLVQGTETLGQTTFVLPALASDATSCLLPPSPYVY